MARSLGLNRVPTLDPEGEQEYPSHEYVRSLVRALNSNFEILNNAFGGSQSTINEVLLQMASATVLDNQTTTSTSYVDLSTVGPTVTVDTKEKALVFLSSWVDNSGANLSHISPAVSGATTIAAADANSLEKFNPGFETVMVMAEFTGLTPGVNTFTAKYKVSGGTGTFVFRRIFVLPFP